MYSLNFPDMLSASSTNLAKDHNATMNNLRLSLLSFKGELFGDPYFGSNLANVLFDSNSPIIKDVVIDEICDNVQTFMPQVTVKRSGINVTSEGTHLYASINATNSLNYTTDLYNVKLTESEQ